MNEMLLVRWDEGDCKGWTDLFPLAWFKSEGKVIRKIHAVRGPRGSLWQAQCDVSTSDRVAKLDYSRYRDFNEKQHMDLGIMRLNFKNEMRRIIESVQWKRPDKPEWTLCKATTKTEISDLGGRNEVERLKILGEISRRPDQAKFSDSIRVNYNFQCAVTGCTIPEVLEAAHIRTHKGLDENSNGNGILLRSDIHALFDSFLITFADDGGAQLKLSKTLTDPQYEFLKKVRVAAPIGEPPSRPNVLHHRQCFRKRERNR
jgi:hypothetical protein